MTEREVEKTTRFGFRRPAERAAALRSYLIVKEGKERGARIEPRAERATIGRASGAALRLTDAGVSSAHCAVWSAGGVVWIEDLGSSNGTYVDEQPIAAPTPLPVGATVALGRTTLRHELRAEEELERERALELDLERAARHVASLLPEPIESGAVRVSWRYLPTARLGGDAFGYRWLDADHFAFYLIDVSGHGVEAALHAVSVLGALRAGQLADADPLRPNEVLASLNRTYPMATHGGLYFTAWYGVFDKRERSLRFGGAGHPAPLLRSAGEGSTLERCVSRNPPIGLAEEVKYAAAERLVAPGSTLYVFSDGVFEIESDEGETWGYERLAEIVARPRIRAIAETARIEGDVRAALPGRHFDDDVSLLVVDFD